MTWEERLETIVKAGAITGVITFNDEDGVLLTDEESERAQPLLNLAAAAAEKLAYNMVKGVLKYKTESRLAREWVDFGIDDAVDTVNYLFLIRAALDEEAKELEEERGYTEAAS